MDSSRGAPASSGSVSSAPAALPKPKASWDSTDAVTRSVDNSPDSVGLGRDVGFKIRFSDHTHADGYIKLMTDGILRAEAQQDALLERYDTPSRCRPISLMRPTLNPNAVLSPSRVVMASAQIGDKSI